MDSQEFISFSLHPASLRSPLDKSGSTVESRFIDLSALAGWIGADFIPPVAYRLSITSSLLPIPGPYIDHSNRCVPVQQGKTTGQTRFSMTSHHPILTSFRAGWTHKRNICFLWSCLTPSLSMQWRGMG